MTRDARRRGRAVRRGDHERRRVGRRLRLRERRARAHRGRRPDGRVARRLVPGRDQAGEAAVLRDACAGTPVFGLPGNPVSSLVSFELFARPALRHDDGPRPAVPPRGRRARAAHAMRAPAPTASCTSTGSSSTWSTAATSRPSVRPAGEQRARGDRRRQRPRAAPRRRRRRRRRPRHRDAPRLTTSQRPSDDRRRASARGDAPGRSSPSPPRDEPRRPHERTARRTGRLSPSARCSPRGRRGARRRASVATTSADIWTSPCGDGAAACTPRPPCSTVLRRSPPWSPGSRSSTSPSAAAPSATEPTRSRQRWPSDRAVTARHLGVPSGNETTGPPTASGGAGFALAPRRLKRPVRRLRINASP